ncbi:MAG: lactoylglutathione lyase [Burkholderiales bacterium]|nr:lactoylglutathione lyase [Burkholderiales bacterium]
MRILHTMIRVKDLNKSIEFYNKVLNMEVIKKKDYPNGKFTLVFMGYGSEEETALIELTYNWGVSEYELGNAFGHIAIEIEDMDKICQLAIQYGGRVTREPGPMKFGGERNIAFIEDPDGYKIELIEHQSLFADMHTRLDFGNT